MFRAVVGATIAVSAQQYAEIGGFRDVPVHGVEDVEFGYRLQNNGAVLIADRQAVHWHQGERTMSGERIARLFEVRQPYIERLIPVGGFRTKAPSADGPTEVVPQLLVRFTDVGTPVGVLRERADRIARDAGTNVEVRFGPLDDGFEVSFAQLAMPSSVRLGADTVTTVIDKMIRENVGSLLLVGTASDPVLEVIRTRALRRVRSGGSLDRSRLRRLFGFDYTVEMFVPAAKRQWGYYVFPLLEGARFVGRIEAKADRAAGTLSVLNHWAEPGIAPSRQLAARLDAELSRLCRLAGLDSVLWTCPRP